MLFGIPEIKEYEKTCTDPYVLAIIKKLWESKSNAAKWLEETIKLKRDIEELEYQNKRIEDNLADLQDIVKYAKKNN